MQAFKVVVTVPEDRIVKLPDEIPTGPAEVIVLQEPKRNAQSEKLREFLAYVEEARVRLQPTLTKDEIDRYIEEERKSWGDA
jgi:hypothetical protein